jgi:hypothetical protein
MFLFSLFVITVGGLVPVFVQQKTVNFPSLVSTFQGSFSSPSLQGNSIVVCFDAFGAVVTPVVTDNSTGTVYTPVGGPFVNAGQAYVMCFARINITTTASLKISVTFHKAEICLFLSMPMSVVSTLRQLHVLEQTPQ